MANNVPASRQTEQMALQQANMRNRNLVLAIAQNRITQIFSETYTGSAANLGRVINIPVRNVGLLKRFYIEVEATAARSAAETHTRTAWGPANILSQIVMTDLSNQTRINTTGWHLHALASAKRMYAFGGAVTTDSPVDIAANVAVFAAPASFTTGNQTIRQWYEVPVSYSDVDLRGAIWASVVNATMNLQLTLNANFSVASTADEALAVYQSDGADLATLTPVTVTVYQEYLDQVPMGDKGPILPGIDISIAYLLNNTVATGMAVNQEFAIPYANFRDFLSTFLFYDQNGTFNAGTDISQFALRSANYSQILQMEPFLNCLRTRNIIRDDFPAAVYYFDHRAKPINTMQYGNMELVFTPTSVAASSQALVGYEMMALTNQVSQAGSLYNT